MVSYKRNRAFEMFKHESLLTTHHTINSKMVSRLTRLTTVITHLKLYSLRKRERYFENEEMVLLLSRLNERVNEFSKHMILDIDFNRNSSTTFIIEGKYRFFYYTYYRLFDRNDERAKRAITFINVNETLKDISYVRLRNFKIRNEKKNKEKKK